MKTCFVDGHMKPCYKVDSLHDCSEVVSMTEHSEHCCKFPCPLMQLMVVCVDVMLYSVERKK